jgi:hypothetical protein
LSGIILAEGVRECNAAGAKRDKSLRGTGYSFKASNFSY